jgi:hypothetical protein
MVPVGRAVLTTPYRRWEQWKVGRCARAVGKGGSGGSSDGHVDREVQARERRGQGQRAHKESKAKLERISVNVGRVKAETEKKVCRRERQVMCWNL